MKNTELKLHIIEVLEPVVARVEELVESDGTPEAEAVASLKNDLRALYDAVCEVERTEVEQPENPVQRMRNSVSELKRKLTLISEETPAEGTPAKESAVETEVVEAAVEMEASTEMPAFEPVAEVPAVEPEIPAEPETPVAAEPAPAFDPKPVFEPESRLPEPDLSAFMPDERDEPTSYVTQITAMVQAKAEQQDMSRVAVSSTAMPDPEIEKQMANRSDIFTRLQEETRKINSDDPQNALRTLVEKMKSGKTVNDVCQGTTGNIKTLIGLNEKFLLLNQLFKGNIKEYNELLQDIDTQENREDALHTLDTYRERYRWNVEDLPYITLQDMIGKRFPER